MTPFKSETDSGESKYKPEKVTFIPPEVDIKGSDAPKISGTLSQHIIEPKFLMHGATSITGIS